MDKKENDNFKAVLESPIEFLKYTIEDAIKSLDFEDKAKWTEILKTMDSSGSLLNSPERSMDDVNDNENENVSSIIDKMRQEAAKVSETASNSGSQFNSPIRNIEDVNQSFENEPLPAAKDIWDVEGNTNQDDIKPILFCDQWQDGARNTEHSNVSDYIEGLKCVHGNSPSSKDLDNPMEKMHHHGMSSSEESDNYKKRRISTCDGAMKEQERDGLSNRENEILQNILSESSEYQEAIGNERHFVNEKLPKDKEIILPQSAVADMQSVCELVQDFSEIPLDQLQTYSSAFMPSVDSPEMDSTNRPRHKRGSSESQLSNVTFESIEDMSNSENDEISIVNVIMKEQIDKEIAYQKDLCEILPQERPPKSSDITILMYGPKQAESTSEDYSHVELISYDSRTTTPSISSLDQHNEKYILCDIHASERKSNYEGLLQASNETRKPMPKRNKTKIRENVNVTNKNYYSNHIESKSMSKRYREMELDTSFTTNDSPMTPPLPPVQQNKKRFFAIDMDQGLRKNYHEELLQKEDIIRKPMPKRNKTKIRENVNVTNKNYCSNHSESKSLSKRYRETELDTSFTTNDSPMTPPLPPVQQNNKRFFAIDMDQGLRRNYHEEPLQKEDKIRKSRKQKRRDNFSHTAETNHEKRKVKKRSNCSPREFFKHDRKCREFDKKLHKKHCKRRLIGENAYSGEESLTYSRSLPRSRHVSDYAFEKINEYDSDLHSTARSKVSSLDVHFSTDEEKDRNYYDNIRARNHPQKIKNIEQEMKLRKLGYSPEPTCNYFYPDKATCTKKRKWAYLSEESDDSSELEEKLRFEALFSAIGKYPVKVLLKALITKLDPVSISEGDVNMWKHAANKILHCVKKRKSTRS